MKRVVSTIVLSLTVYLPMDGQLLFHSVTGSLQYQHQFQDANFGTGYSKFTRSNPQINLATGGYLYSPSLLAFNLRTLFNINYNAASSGQMSTSSKQWMFNYYDLGISALQNSHVKVDLSARDGEVESKSSVGPIDGNFSRFRHQRQRIGLTTNAFEFLPSTFLTYSRSRHWSPRSDNRVDQVQRDYSFGLSKADAKNSISLSGSYYENHERYSGLRNNYLRLLVNGMKEFTEQERVDMNVEYYKYNVFQALTANSSFNTILKEKIRMSTSLSGRNTSSPYATIMSYTLNQNYQYQFDQNIGFSFGINGSMGSESYRGGAKITPRGWGASGSVSHRRSLGATGFGNNVSLGYGRHHGVGTQTMLSGSLMNNAQTILFDFNIDITQTFTANRNYGYYDRSEVTNALRVNIAGALPRGIITETTVDYTDQQYAGAAEVAYILRTLRLQERLRASFYYYIPFNVGVGGSLNWLWNARVGRHYGINANISSPQFFLRTLSLGYSISRSYDPSYRRVHQTQSLEAQYQWRALSFQLRVQEIRFGDKRREILFMVSRPLNFGL